MKHQCFQFITRLSASSSSAWLHNPSMQQGSRNVQDPSGNMNTVAFGVRPFDCGPTGHIRNRQNLNSNTSQPAPCCTQQPQVSPVEAHQLNSPFGRQCFGTSPPHDGGTCNFQHTCFGFDPRESAINAVGASCHWGIGSRPLHDFNNVANINSVPLCPYGHVVVSPG